MNAITKDVIHALETFRDDIRQNMESLDRLIEVHKDNVMFKEYLEEELYHLALKQIEINTKIDKISRGEDI